MKTRLGLWALYATADRFVSIPTTEACPLSEIASVLQGSSVCLTDGVLLWKRIGREPVSVALVTLNTADFGFCPEGPDAACTDPETYFACCQPMEDWIRSTPDGLILPLSWWSATEGIHADDGRWIRAGKTLQSRPICTDKPAHH